MKRPESRVFIVEDDPSMRNALKNLLRSVGLESQQFASAQEFLDAERPDIPSCLILDVRLPGQSGLDLQRELANADIHIPIIFITAHGDPTTRAHVERVLPGAPVLAKPVTSDKLRDAIAAVR